MPLGLKLPVSVAESVTEPPGFVEAEESEVVIVGLVLETVKGSQADVAGLLFASPE